MRNTHFRTGHVELARANDPGLIPDTGTSRFARVDELQAQGRAKYYAGYALPG
jgi:hypothetical protein